MTAGAKVAAKVVVAAAARVLVAAKAEAKKAQDGEWDDVMDAWRSNEVASFSAPVVQDVQPSDKVKKEKSPKATLAVAENTASSAASVNRKKKKSHLRPWRTSAQQSNSLMSMVWSGAVTPTVESS